jgi:site-specific recombinase XerD
LVYSGPNNERLKTWVAKAKIMNKKITWHSARHTYGQLLHEEEVDIATVANLMGDNIQTVIKNYVRISEKTKRQAVKKLPF